MCRPKMLFVNLNAKNQSVGLVTGKIVKGAWLTSNWVRRILAARHQRTPSEQPVPVLEAPQQARVAWALFEGRPVRHSNCCHTFKPHRPIRATEVGLRSRDARSNREQRRARCQGAEVLTAVASRKKQSRSTAPRSSPRRPRSLHQ